jgi:hypothetical protein
MDPDDSIDPDDCAGRRFGCATVTEMREARKRLRELLEQRALSKGGWREDARILAEHFSEDFGEPHDLPVPSVLPTPPNAANAVFAAEPASGNPTLPTEQEPATIAPGPSQNACNVPPALSPVLALAPLPAAFWRSVLYGSPDALLATVDATQATRLVAQTLGVPSVALSEFTGSLRAGQLRKSLRERFGQVEAEQAMNKLWRAAPLTDGCPSPNLEAPSLSPGPLLAGRNQPRWIAELNEPGGAQRAWLIENGLWCG